MISFIVKESLMLFLTHCREYIVQFSSVQFSFISAPPHEQNNKMLKSLCVVKDGVRKRKLYRIHCAATTVNALYRIHAGLCHPGITRMYHYIRQRNLPYSLDDFANENYAIVRSPEGREVTVFC